MAQHYIPPSKQQIRSWLERQRTLKTPSPAYYEWLRRQYKLVCAAEVIKKQP